MPVRRKMERLSWGNGAARILRNVTPAQDSHGPSGVGTSRGNQGSTDSLLNGAAKKPITFTMKILLHNQSRRWVLHHTM